MEKKCYLFFSKYVIFRPLNNVKYQKAIGFLIKYIILHQYLSEKKSCANKNSSYLICSPVVRNFLKYVYSVFGATHLYFYFALLRILFLSIGSRYMFTQYILDINLSISIVSLLVCDVL